MEVINTQGQTKKRGQIETQIDDLNGATDNLNNLLNDLRQRLIPVIHSEPISSEGELNEKAPCLCPMAEVLRSINQKIGNKIKDLEYILENLEI